MNVPNTLSIMRLLTIPVLIILIINSTAENYPYLIAVFVVSMLLDFFDGFFARLLNQETELGKILDPVADKLMIIGTVVALTISAGFPIWLAALILGRDLVILIASFFLFKDRHKVQPSVLIGKFAFSVMGLLIFIYIIDLAPAFDMEIVKRFLIVLNFSFIMWSFIEYYNVFKKVKHAK